MENNVLTNQNEVLINRKKTLQTQKDDLNRKVNDFKNSQHQEEQKVLTEEIKEILQQEMETINYQEFVIPNEEASDSVPLAAKDRVITNFKRYHGIAETNDANVEEEAKETPTTPAADIPSVPLADLDRVITNFKRYPKPSKKTTKATPITQLDPEPEIIVQEVLDHDEPL